MVKECVGVERERGGSVMLTRARIGVCGERVSE